MILDRVERAYAGLCAWSVAEPWRECPEAECWQCGIRRAIYARSLAGRWRAFWARRVLR